jgi:hypothetical protein
MMFIGRDWFGKKCQLVGGQVLIVVRFASKPLMILL